MSAMQEVKKTWGDKFGGELPASSFWVEDVLANLETHKARMEMLKQSLREEEEYVRFLENLLEEITAKTAHGNGEEATGSEKGAAGNDCTSPKSNNITEVIQDTLQRRYQDKTGGGDNSKTKPFLLKSSDERKRSLSKEDGTSSDSTRTGGKASLKKADGQSGKTGSSSLSSSSSSSNATSSAAANSSPDPNNEEHFVTVIEVSGADKKSGGNKDTTAAEECNGSSRRPVPPIPPPKNIKRGSVSSDLPTPPANRLPFTSFGHGVDTANKPHEMMESQLRFVEDKDCLEWLGERNVVFDSKINKQSSSSRRGQQVGGKSSEGSSLSSTSSNTVPQPPPTNGAEENVFLKPAVKKKFEGSKLPLPPKGSNMLPRRKNVPSSLDLTPSPSSERKNGARSKISDMIGKLEGNNMLRGEMGSELTPRRSFRLSSQQKPVKHRPTIESETHLDDYMDPLDAQGLISEDIYDLPPSSPASTKSLEVVATKPQNQRNAEQPQKQKQQHPQQLELEPMYDTVAPDDDNEQNDDDYVVLLDEECKSGTEGARRGDNDSGAKQRKRPVGKDAGGVVKGDSATIRSQTSVVSGHSIATTSSGTTSETEGYMESPVPNDFLNRERTPSTNYVNLDYFLCKTGKNEGYVSESEPDSETESILHRAMAYENASEMNLKTNGNSLGCDEASSNGMEDALTKANAEAPTMRVADQVKLRSFQSRISTIAASETQYVEVLNLLLQYMKAMKGTFSTSKPVLSTDDFNIIFYKIPELHSMHQKFLVSLQDESSVSKWEVGKHFEKLAKEVDIYGSFLQNYSRAVDTVKKCSQSNAAFAETTRDIRSRTCNINAGVTLETLLHSPVSRVQKNLEIVTDLLKLLPESHPDVLSLENAQKLFQSFLTEFKMIQPEQLSEKSARTLVKNSFMVELHEGTRKLRHLFLFNDVLVCAKYKATGKQEKFTYELKWHMPITDCMVVENSEQRDTASINLVALRSRASNVRDQIKRQCSRDDKQKAEKNRKKLAGLESQLVLASPNLIFKVKAAIGKSTGTFFLSSEYDRSQWIETIETLKRQSTILPATAPLSSNELQQWITRHRKDLKTNMYMGSYLLRSGRDENMLVGDFYILIGQLSGIKRPADLFICLEVDSYGHYFRKAKTKMICGSSQPSWNEDFVIELEGALNLRVLLYEEHPTQGQLTRGATTVELNRSWIQGSLTKAIEKTISMQDYTLSVSTRFTPSEMTIRRVPTSKAGALFGAKITQVCKREKRQVPFIITSCVKEVERRGINEQGIYRVSGSVSDGVRLKKAFESNCYEAEQLLKEVDVNSVASLLKTYLRELPEALFTDDLYPKFFDAFSLGDDEIKSSELMQIFDQLPPLNQHIIMYLLDHMTRINQHEKHNKMSINNLATVFGPTLLRPGGKSSGNASMDQLAAGTANCIAQTGILYFFLWKRASNQEQSHQMPPSYLAM
ncbi:active breakpoint cluster region-related protein isoform X2 [Folsomia candida]|uniref:active breakpoint cluster region-related protein isoform X2 n=1 Tax=Folsomia candida TaxID=158441 RepID=UPI000B8F2844|nr:active breakpoint cluster region-related protein isoform X2 [Folsomia candida]